MDKKELNELLKSNKDIKLSSSYKENIIKNFLREAGITFIIISIEEINELIEVLTKNLLDGNVDINHTMEEVADVSICKDAIISYYRIKRSNLEKLEKHKVKPLKDIKDSKSIYNVLDEVHYLTEVNHILSKIFRGKNIHEENIIDVVNTLNIACYHVTNYYKLKKGDISKIKKYKLKRIRDRVKAGNPLNV